MKIPGASLLMNKVLYRQNESNTITDVSLIWIFFNRDTHTHTRARVEGGGGVFLQDTRQSAAGAERR